MSSYDEFLPDYGWSAAYSIRVSAAPERIFEAIEEADFSRAPLVRLMFALRRLPRRRLSMAGFQAAGQCTLLREPGRGQLLGFAGRPWNRNDRWPALSPTEFMGFREPGFVRIVWGFTIDPPSRPGGPCRLVTETRIQATDDFARRKFARYWLWIAPFSGLVRKAMLKEIRRRATAP